MSVIKDFVLAKGGETQAQSHSTNTNTNNISINVSSDQGNVPLTPQPVNVAPAVITQAATPQPVQISPQGSQNFTVPPQQPGQAIITEDPGAVAYPSTLLPDSQVQLSPEVQARLQRAIDMENDLEFYRRLSTILSNILKDNNPKLIANVIDCSGKIIVSGNDLVNLIAIKTHKDPSEITLRYRDVEPGCCAKISPIKNISDIKINNESFSLKYNADYNILKDDFNISLERVIISPVISYH